MANIKADEISKILREQIANYEQSVSVDEVGAIISVGDGIARIHGLEKAMSGEMLAFPHNIFGLALNLEEEVRRFQFKVEAGADFAVTHPVFQVEQLARFLERARSFAPHLPVIAGIWPLTSFRNAEFMNNEVPGISVPPAVMERMRTADSGERARQEGLKIAQETLMEIRSLVQGCRLLRPSAVTPWRWR